MKSIQLGSIAAIFLLIFIGATLVEDGKTAIPSRALDDAPSGKHNGDIVRLVDGASTAKAALDHYVAASDAGDAEAALLMIDPPIRRLLVPEMAIEKFAIESSLFERTLFGPPKFEIGGMLFHNALPSLVRIRDVRILETRRIDDERVVFTVLTRERSYHDENDMRNVVEFLAVKRSDKWHLFRPMGYPLILLRTPMMAPDLKLNRPLVEVHRPSDEKTLRENADFEIECVVPIEEIHRQFVVVAKTSPVDECQRLAEKVRRQYECIKQRAIRHDFGSRDAFEAALQPTSELADELSDKFVDAFLPAIREIGDLLPPEAAVDAK